MLEQLLTCLLDLSFQSGPELDPEPLEGSVDDFVWVEVFLRERLAFVPTRSEGLSTGEFLRICLSVTIS
jgi:hypothetical protein